MAGWSGQYATSYQPGRILTCVALNAVSGTILIDHDHGRPAFSVQFFLERPQHHALERGIPTDAELSVSLLAPLPSHLFVLAGGKIAVAHAGPGAIDQFAHQMKHPHPVRNTDVAPA